MGATLTDCGLQECCASSGQRRAQGYRLALAKKQVLSAAAAAVLAVSLTASPALANSQVGYAQKKLEPAADLVWPLCWRSPAGLCVNNRVTQHPCCADH